MTTFCFQEPEYNPVYSPAVREEQLRQKFSDKVIDNVACDNVISNGCYIDW